MLESSHVSSRPVKAVGYEGDLVGCDFFDENFQRAYCNVEGDMHMIVNQVLDPEDVVMEVGGRYGTTTCSVATKQNNSGALIVVEPDPKVWAIHEFNKLTHNCASWSVFGVLGDKDMTVLANTSFYNIRTSHNNEDRGVKVRHFNWELVEKMTELTVDTVIMDCEGCWVDLVKENLDKFRRVNKVILGTVRYSIFLTVCNSILCLCQPVAGLEVV